jgi:hypothetical protein
MKLSCRTARYAALHAVYRFAWCFRRAHVEFCADQPENRREAEYGTKYSPPAQGVLLVY